MHYVTLRSHVSERDQNVQIRDFFVYLCQTDFLPLSSPFLRSLGTQQPWTHLSERPIIPFMYSGKHRGFLTVRGRVGWSLSEQHPLLFIRPFTSTLTTWSLKQRFCNSSSQLLEFTTWCFPAFFCVFESLCLLHGGWRRRTVWMWNMKVGFSLVDSCKLQTHRSGSVCDEAAVCQPLHPKAKQRLHFILSACVARRSPDGGSASLFFHVGGKSFKSKTSRSVRSTNVWTGREPNLQPPISSCRVSQQFHEACGWNLTERSELAPENLVSLWAFTSLHQRTPGSGRTAAFDTLWKRKSCFSSPSYRTKNTPCVYRSFILTVATFTYVVLVYIHPSSPDSVGLGCRC